MTFNPLDHQRKIIQEYEEQNKKAQETIYKAIENGYNLTYWTRLHGAYTNHVTYWLSDGTSVEFVEPTRLNWIDLDLNLYR